MFESVNHRTRAFGFILDHSHFQVINRREWKKSKQMALAVDFDESTDNEVDHPKTDR